MANLSTKRLSVHNSPRSQRKQVHINAVTNVKTKHAIKEYTEQKGITVSDFINSLVEAHFKKIGFVASPLPLVPDYEARFDNRDQFVGPDYDALRAFLFKRRMSASGIEDTCRVMFFCKKANLSDEEVLKHSAYVLLHMLRESENRSLRKSLETNINWYKDFLTSRMGAIGDDLSCKKEASA